MTLRGYEISFAANGGVLSPFEFESSTLTTVLQQIIALKTIESKLLLQHLVLL